MENYLPKFMEKYLPVTGVLFELETQRKLGYERGFEDALDKVIETYDKLANDDVVSVGLIRQNALDLKIQMQRAIDSRK